LQCAELWQKDRLNQWDPALFFVIGIVILTITARWLGPEGRGTIAL